MTDSLLRNAFEGRLVVEAEVASVDDIVGLGLLRELIQGSQVTYCIKKTFSIFARAEIKIYYGVKLTANISNAENADRASIDDTALIRQEGNSSRSWHGLVGRAASTVGHVATLGIVARRLLRRMKV